MHKNNVTTMEANFLSGLNSWTEKLRKAKIAVDNEKRKIIESTVDTATYCSSVGISRQTLTNRRIRGDVKYVMLNTEYRYFLPEEGVSNA